MIIMARIGPTVDKSEAGNPKQIQIKANSKSETISAQELPCFQPSSWAGNPEAAGLHPPDDA
jgi:hypothetical protein